MGYSFGAAAAVLALAFVIAAPGTSSADDFDPLCPVSAAFTAGKLLLLDNGDPHERFVGGTLRFYISPRVSVGPEVTFSSRLRYQHLMVTANATFDLIASVAGQPRLITPFAVVGGGTFHRSVDLPEGGVYASSEGVLTGGAGARVRLGSRAYVGAEMRFGLQLHFRPNALVGVQFGR